MSTNTTRRKERLPFALWALAAGFFGVGTSEFVMVGLLLNVAGDLKVSTSAAGLLVTDYALGVVAGALLVAPSIRRLPRKTALLVLMGLFVVGNLLCAVSFSYPMLMAARAITGLAHAAFFGTSAIIATELVPITGFNESSVGPILLLFGIGFVVGNAIGGKLADHSLMTSLLGILSFLALVLVGFTFTSHDPVPTLVTVFLFGVAAFGIVPCLQLRVVDKAKGAPNLASAFNIASFNLGSAVGAYLGSIVLSSPMGLNAVPWVGGLVAVAGIAVAAFRWSLDNRHRSGANIAVEQKC